MTNILHLFETLRQDPRQIYSVLPQLLYNLYTVCAFHQYKHTEIKSYI